MLTNDMKLARLERARDKAVDKWTHLRQKRGDILFDVALLAGSKVWSSGEDLASYVNALATVNTMHDGETPAYHQAVVTVLKDKAAECLELDERIRQAWESALAKSAAYMDYVKANRPAATA